eukprot:5537414-Pleurochrysis_carterae.AAC.3
MLQSDLILMENVYSGNNVLFVGFVTPKTSVSCNSELLDAADAACPLRKRVMHCLVIHQTLTIEEEYGPADGRLRI